MKPCAHFNARMTSRDRPRPAWPISGGWKGVPPSSLLFFSELLDALGGDLAVGVVEHQRALVEVRLDGGLRGDLDDLPRGDRRAHALGVAGDLHQFLVVPVL